ncbi:MAG TPA: hypothetical protein VFY29_05010, partial [Terriglobia bacterium]|nr:hypothetical protein [Terriglobia bacterium]
INNRFVENKAVIDLVPWETAPTGRTGIQDASAAQSASVLFSSCYPRRVCFRHFKLMFRGVRNE